MQTFLEPRGISTDLPKEESEKCFFEAFKDVEASIIVVGHTHEPFIKRLDGFTVVNPGSLGVPNDKPFCCTIQRAGEIQIAEFS
jgi:predicted phosphodiesterase